MFKSLKQSVTYKLHLPEEEQLFVVNLGREELVEVYLSFFPGISAYLIELLVEKKKGQDLAKTEKQLSKELESLDD